MDAFDLIARYNNKDVLMYLDPPYVRSSRKSGRLYRHEMYDAQQVRLLDLVTASDAQIALSGYPSDLYDSALQGWRKFTASSQTTSTEKALECLWINYDPPMEQMKIEE